MTGVQTCALPIYTTADDNVTYAPISPVATAVAIEAAQEMYVENVETAEESAAEAEVSSG